MATTADTLSVSEDKNENGCFQQDIPPIKYEFYTHVKVHPSNLLSDLDHTADIQLHSWGKTLTEAFEQVAIAMFGYMTEIDKVDMLEKQNIEAEGEDMLSLLFHFLDEWLFVFSAEPFFIPRKVVITHFNKEEFKIQAVGYGETFDLDKHPQGSEVKAITYSHMQVHENEGQSDIFCIVDI